MGLMWLNTCMVVRGKAIQCTHKDLCVFYFFSVPEMIPSPQGQNRGFPWLCVCCSMMGSGGDTWCWLEHSSMYNEVLCVSSQYKRSCVDGAR